MATQVQFRGGSTSEHSTFTGAAREVTVDTTLNTVVVHDGSTAGGHPLANKNNPSFTGNVGIGTTSPASGLHLSGAATVDSRLTFTQTTAGLTGTIQQGSSGFEVAAAGTQSINFVTNGTEQARIDSSGNVGIGTSAPNNPLEVNFQSSSAWTSGQNLATPTTNNNINALRLWNSSSAANAETSLLFLSGGSNAAQHSINVVKTGTNAGDLVFRRRTGGASSAESARIDSAGRLLVGATTSVVNGNNSIELVDTGVVRTVMGRNDSTVSAGNVIGAVDWYGNGGDGSTWEEVASIQVEADGTHATGDKPGRLVFSTTASSASSPTEAMRITSANKVGIGGIDPDLYSTDADNLVIKGDFHEGISIIGGNTNSSNIYFGDSDAFNRGIIKYNHVGDEFIIRTAATDAVLINNVGNVGIGENSPDHELHIKAIDPTIMIESEGSYGDNPSILFRAKDSTSTVRNMVQIDGVGTGSNSGALRFFTRNSGTLGEVARFDSSGRLLLGTTSALTTGDSLKLHLLDTAGAKIGIGRNDTTTTTDNTIGDITFYGNDSNGTYEGCARIRCRADAAHGTGNKPSRLEFSTTASGASSPTERARIDSSGRLLVGTSNAETRFGFTPKLQVEGTGVDAGIALARYSNDNSGPTLIFSKSRGTSVGSDTIVAENSVLGAVYFAGADGTDQSSTAASILVQVDGTPGADDMPGRLVFSTTADGASSPTEHFRIASNGDLTATDTTIGSNSDSRLKTNVTDFSYDLEDFKLYQPKTFDWKNPELHGNKAGQRGFIAQDVEAIDAYWVGQQAVDEESADAQFLDADRLAKTLKLGKKDAMYISVIQQLLAKVETLEAKVAALEAG